MRAILASIALLTSGWAFSQAMFFDSAVVPDSAVVLESGVMLDPIAMPDSVPARVYESVADSLINEVVVTDTVVSMRPMPRYVFMPAVFTTYNYLDTTSIFTPDFSGDPSMRWTEEAAAQNRLANRVLQYMFIQDPGSAQYNILDLPEAPKNFEVELNPENHTITIREIVNDITGPTIEAEAVKRKYWIRAFNSSLQFSQAYVSPNWYQGGNNNINALLDLKYNVKLNQKFHPKLLFETTFQYKLGINSAPDDSLRNYNVSTDILQINSLFGYKAANRWYYSLTGLFKTQLVNSFKSNSKQLRSAFMAPADLTLGLGMTYNYVNPKKTMTLDISVAPLSYHLAICADNRLNVASYGIDPGKHFKSSYGSSLDTKMVWQITPIVNLTSRLTAFTDYDRFYSDWENTLVFQVSRFFTTQLYMHMRYDTDTPRDPDSNWKKFQVKEILSIGFSYNFSTI